ncbi:MULTISPECIES: hypothetical protein [Arthrobacter]|uniref:Uncharacterized protein n=1 Tax=Arthrobacter terricola TaxID=2547396 RepID=A0A4R5KMY4_9MICC|nr:MULTISPECIES: hypothetical protein [Arthrobacter]MBT8161036.1 hypothetical protein [Arthrobacter sp. GN70]TDF96896.1 hypothetical protein E1809_09245 [Arthrobacter terricola]
MSGWDRNEELNKLSSRRLDGANLILAKMWIYHRDLEVQSWTYAQAKTEYGRRYARVVVQCRLEGEKSAEVAGRYADMDEEVHKAHAAYRLAEQMVTANREALRILHAELDAHRTARADARMADEFQARTSI